MQKSRKKQSFFNTDRKMDITFLSLVLILLTIGLVMLFSASYAYSFAYFGGCFNCCPHTEFVIGLCVCTECRRKNKYCR